MHEHAQDETITLYANFLNRSGSPATVTGTPQVMIVHNDTNDSIKTDVAYTNMSVNSGTMISSYYYRHHIPARSDKAVYTVTYSGTYADGTNAVGSETFKVIPQKFYRRKGGGFVSRTSGEKVWTDDDKSLIFDALERLLNKKISFESIESKLDKTMDSIGALSFVVDSQKEYFQRSHNDLSNKLIKKEDIMFDDSRIISRIRLIEEELSKLDTSVKNDRSGSIIASIEDLRKELDDLKETYVDSLSVETIGRLNNGPNERTYSKKV